MKGVYLEGDLIQSEAFRSLSRWGLLVYLRFFQKRVMVKENRKGKATVHRIANNGEIVFPYREALALGIDERAFRNAIDELISKGFLDITRPGKGGRSGESTLYLIDTRWRDYGTERFRPPQKPRIKNTIQGRGWAAYNARKKLKPADKNASATSGKIDRSLEKKSAKRLAELPAVKKEKIAVTHCRSAKNTQSTRAVETSGKNDSILKITRGTGKRETDPENTRALRGAPAEGP
jgi:hypothetical protein